MVSNKLDWVIIKLAKPGHIKMVIVDTNHFKGNYPDSCSLEGCNIHDNNSLPDNKTRWSTLLPKSKLEADNEQKFEKEITNKGPFSHVRLNIFPDG